MAIKIHNLMQPLPTPLGTGGRVMDAKIKATFMDPIIEAMYDKTPEHEQIIEVLRNGNTINLAWATGTRVTTCIEHNAVEFVVESYTGGITVSPIIGNAEYWRYPGESEWRR